MAELPKSKSTGGFFRPELSPCTDILKRCRRFVLTENGMLRSELRSAWSSVTPLLFADGISGARSSSPRIENMNYVKLVTLYGPNISEQPRRDVNRFGSLLQRRSISHSESVQTMHSVSLSLPFQKFSWEDERKKEGSVRKSSLLPQSLGPGILPQVKVEGTNPQG